jgi:hypothetical protein
MSEDKKPQAKITALRRVFNGFFKVDEYDIEMDRHEGGTQKVVRQIFERGHAVGILAYDPVADRVAFWRRADTPIRTPSPPAASQKAKAILTPPSARPGKKPGWS